MVEFKKVFSEFLNKNIISCKPLGGGNINPTYLIEAEASPESEKYVLQRINTSVFKDVDSLMNNIFSVSEFLGKKVSAQGVHSRKNVLTFIKTSDQKNYFTDSEGCCWRLSYYISDSASYDTPETPEMFNKCGFALGEFERLLSDFPAETLAETIPDFHNTQKRYEDFKAALSRDSVGRAHSAKEQIDSLTELYDDCKKFLDFIEEKQLPIRVTHNDTKFNNFLFDKASGEYICMVDFDTIMPGYSIYDFADAVRSGANLTGECETDLSRVSLSLEYFEAFASGYLKAASKYLSQKEIDCLACSVFVLSFECAARFLADYLDGDVYFKTDYDNHNLERARNQLALSYDIKDKMAEMTSIIKELTF